MTPPSSLPLLEAWRWSDCLNPSSCSYRLHPACLFEPWQCREWSCITPKTTYNSHSILTYRSVLLAFGRGVLPVRVLITCSFVQFSVSQIRPLKAQQIQNTRDVKDERHITERAGEFWKAAWIFWHENRPKEYGTRVVTRKGTALSCITTARSPVFTILNLEIYWMYGRAGSLRGGVLR